MSKANNKYGVKPEVLAKIKFTPRDKELTKSVGYPHNNTLIQGVVNTTPEQWNEGQLEKAKRYKLNTRSAEEIRHFFDNEAGGE